MCPVEAIWRKLSHTFQDCCKTEGEVEGAEEGVEFTPGLRWREIVFFN